jgi:hypothetical protein
MRELRSLVTRRSLNILAVLSLLAGLAFSLYVFNYRPVQARTAPAATTNSPQSAIDFVLGFDKLVSKDSFYQIFKTFLDDPLAADSQPGKNPAATVTGEAPALPAGEQTQPGHTAPDTNSTDDPTLTAYLKLLNDRDSLVRQSAINGLGQLGSRAKEAIPPLLGLLSDPDKQVRAAASKALLALGAKEQVVTAWLNLLADRNEDMRQGAAAGLRELGDLQTIANLAAFSTNPDPNVRQVAGEVRTYLKIKLLALNVALGSHD